MACYGAVQYCIRRLRDQLVVFDLGVLLSLCKSRYVRGTHRAHVVDALLGARPLTLDLGCTQRLAVLQRHPLLERALHLP